MSNDKLAPHPLYFTIDGKPAEEKMTIEGKTYIVNWDGKSLQLKDSNGSNGNGNGSNENQDDPVPDPLPPHGFLGLLLVIIFTTVLYGSIFSFFKGYTKLGFLLIYYGILAISLIVLFIKFTK